MEPKDIENFNKHSLPYPKEIGSLAFYNNEGEILSKKDALYKLSIESAKNEFNKLKAIAELINNQAREIQDQLETSALVKQASYNFNPKPNEVYWLVKNKESLELILCILGPTEWSVSPPNNYEYLQKLRYLANGLWQRISQ
jgi:hypothetical protein